MLVSSILTSFPIFSNSFLFSITLFLVAIITSSAVPVGFFICPSNNLRPSHSVICPLFVSNFALFALSNNPVCINACIDIVANINNITIVITKATSVIPLLRFFIFSFLLCIFCKNLTISIVKFQNYYTSA